MTSWPLEIVVLQTGAGLQSERDLFMFYKWLSTWDYMLVSQVEPALQVSRNAHWVGSQKSLSPAPVLQVLGTLDQSLNLLCISAYPPVKWILFTPPCFVDEKTEAQKA